MKRIGIVAVLALLLVAMTAVVAQAAPTGPNGAKFVRGVTPECTVDGVTVNCTGAEISGVGNTNATVTLTADYAATVDCYNPGNNPNNPIESHETTFSSTTTSGALSPKNGRLAIPAQSVSPTSTDLADATFCPNENWDAVIREGTLRVVGYTYTIQFVGYPEPFFTLTG